MYPLAFLFYFFFFNDTATTEIYTLSLHDALPISRVSFSHSSATRPLPFPPRGPDGQPQRVQPDEAFGVFLPVDVVLLEGRHVQAVEGPRRPPPGSTTCTLIELDAGGARDVLLRFVHSGLEHLPR